MFALRGNLDCSRGSQCEHFYNCCVLCIAQFINISSADDMISIYLIIYVNEIDIFFQFTNMNQLRMDICSSCNL